MGMHMISPGASVLEVVEEVEDFIRKRAFPAFPVNVGIGSVAAHFTPSSVDSMRFPRSGVVKFDVGVHVEGYIADTAGTVSLGGSNPRLVQASKDALESAIVLVRPGAGLRSIGLAIENVIKSAGFKPISNLTGHSIDRFNLHAGFSVYNTGNFERDEAIPDSIVIAVEPFATDGQGYVVSGKSGNIFSLIRRKRVPDEELNMFQQLIEERYSTLPFAERWLQDVEKRNEMLRKLVRLKVLHSYEILMEAGGGAVSQWEHTLIVDDEGTVVTT
jgi:methionyl aminopeptidase